MCNGKMLGLWVSRWSVQGKLNSIEGTGLVVRAKSKPSGYLHPEDGCFYFIQSSIVCFDVCILMWVGCITSHVGLGYQYELLLVSLCPSFYILQLLYNVYCDSLIPVDLIYTPIRALIRVHRIIDSTHCVSWFPLSLPALSIPVAPPQSHQLYQTSDDSRRPK